MSRCWWRPTRIPNGMRLGDGRFRTPLTTSFSPSSPPDQGAGPPLVTRILLVICARLINRWEWWPTEGFAIITRASSTW